MLTGNVGSNGTLSLLALGSGADGPALLLAVTSHEMLWPSSATSTV